MGECLTAALLANTLSSPYLDAMKGTQHRRIQHPRNRNTGWNLGAPRRDTARTRKPGRSLPATGLQVTGLRFYSPELGRWASRDPIQEPGGLNLYVLSGNGVMSASDAIGLAPVSSLIHVPIPDPLYVNYDPDILEEKRTEADEWLAENWDSEYVAPSKPTCPPGWVVRQGAYGSESHDVLLGTGTLPTTSVSYTVSQDVTVGLAGGGVGGGLTFKKDTSFLIADALLGRYLRYYLDYRLWRCCDLSSSPVTEPITVPGPTGSPMFYGEKQSCRCTSWRPQFLAARKGGEFDRFLAGTLSYEGTNYGLAGAYVNVGPVTITW